MKPTDLEVKAFKNINQTESGKVLVDYCKKLENFAYDSRSWEDGDTKESASHAARLIRKYLIDRLTLINKSKGEQISFE